MTLDQEIEIRCLLSESIKCKNKIVLKEVFDLALNVNCPWKKLLQEKFNNEMASDENKKYNREYLSS